MAFVTNIRYEVFNLFCDEISCQCSSTIHFQQIKTNYPLSAMVWFQPFVQKSSNQNRSMIIAYSLLGGVACRWYCWEGENQLEVYCRGNTPHVIAPWFPFFAFWQYTPYDSYHASLISLFRSFYTRAFWLNKLLLLIWPISECTCLKQMNFI